MKKKINYTDEPLQFGKVVEDFLPPPEQLIPKGKTITQLQVNQFHLEDIQEIKKTSQWISKPKSPAIMVESRWYKVLSSKNLSASKIHLIRV